MWWRMTHSVDPALLHRIDRVLDLLEKVEDDLDTIADNVSMLVEFLTKQPDPEPDPVTGIVAQPTGQPETH